MNSSIRVIEPSGLFDSTQAPKFCHDIEQLLNNKVVTIVVDFKDVTFMDILGTVMD